jgi:hypothetical protein
MYSLSHVPYIPPYLCLIHSVTQPPRRLLTLTALLSGLRFPRLRPAGGLHPHRQARGRLSLCLSLRLSPPAPPTPPLVSLQSECPDAAPRSAQVSKTGGVTARRFNRAKFMAQLKIRPEAMALFASAIGNDFVGQARSLSSAHADASRDEQGARPSSPAPACG